RAKPAKFFRGPPLQNGWCATRPEAGETRMRPESAPRDFPDRASNFQPTSFFTLPAECLRTWQSKLIENAPDYRIGDFVDIFGTAIKRWDGGQHDRAGFDQSDDVADRKSTRLNSSHRT